MAAETAVKKRPKTTSGITYRLICLYYQHWLICPSSDRIIKMKRTKINIGIAAESENDITVLQRFCEKIMPVGGIKVKVRIENRYVNNTQILPRDIEKIKNHFGVAKLQKPKLVILLTDRDNNQYLEKKLILRLETVSFPYPVILAIPEETLEDWIIEDVGTINKIMKSKTEIKTPKKDKHFEAKSWLAAIIAKHKPGSIRKRSP